MDTEEPAKSEPDPTRALELLWSGRLPKPARGPDRGLTLVQITTAAAATAEADGLDALSMRKVAARLGVGVASLYTYVPGRSALLALMLDTFIADAPLPHTVPGTWRAQIEVWARADWASFRSRPWLLRLATVRPLLGPNLLRWYESALRVLARTPLTTAERVAAVETIDGYVHGSARAAVDSAGADAAWEAAHVRFVNSVVDFDQYPLWAEAAVGGHLGDHEAHFEFGLRRILDGIEAHIERSAGPAGPDAAADPAG
ncbi:TetR family transcriptional regulator [Murinocardiopsis flavida]|uniref:TetR family transcriptional regulator n=1 Tax=Murinocardiopsis flavida TaxID=645275 RepID=A0A2P8DE13_9ACTN|nr:TetR/AcrR family transcriptional regulator C-terminal domain-containing protein [Murinocardiopsis flavida]PSK95429.1 TetR family transcriptional regulator [Murinocardiopsis flavida]